MMRYEEFVKQTVEDFIESGVVDPNAFPDMELYMDQAVAFINKHLAIYKEDPTDAKDLVMTKTMIGNYAKHNMIPRPKNKKYTREHLVLLTLIFYLKGTFQMEEIEHLMKPLIDNYNSEFDDKYDFLGIYSSIVEIYKEEQENLLDQVTSDLRKIKKGLMDREMTDDDMSELFMLIVNLSLRADAQKFLAQKLMNEYFMKEEKAPKAPRPPKAPKAPKPPKEKKAAKEKQIVKDIVF